MCTSPGGGSMKTKLIKIALIVKGQSAYKILKADRPHPHNYPHTPTDYRHTDKHF